MIINENTTGKELSELIENGNYLQAVDLIQECPPLEKHNPLRKQYALALSRMGQMKQALEVLQPLEDADHSDHEVGALHAGILKRQWISTGNDEWLNESYERYLQAFKLTGEYWAGINAATLAKVMGLPISSILADEVLNICWDEYGRMGTRSSFWLLVTIAEAHIVKGDVKTALKWYKLVTPMAYKSVGQIKTVRRNARLLGKGLGTDVLQNLMEEIYTPKIAFFAGHRIDREGMPMRFPQGESESVKRKLLAKLGKLRISIGVASLADGADILFHECLIETGRQNRVILPYPVDDFREMLKRDDPGGWLERFDQVISKSSVVETVSRSVFNQDWSVIYELATDFMLGYTMSLTHDLDGVMIPLVVWDKKTQTRGGGTYSAVKKLRSLGYEPEIIAVFPNRHSPDLPSSKSEEDHSIEYLPTRCIVVVVGIGKDIKSHDMIAGELSKYIKDIEVLSASRKISPTKKSLSGKEICLLFRDITPAQDFIYGFSRIHPEASMAAHAGLSVRFDVSLSQASDTFSPAMLEAAELVRKLSSGQRFATIAFSSLAYLESNVQFDFVYRGLFKSDNVLLKLYEMFPAIEKQTP